MHTHTIRKRFGQHFLHDKQIIQRLVDIIAPESSQHFVEIGPGQGALTLPLLKKTGELNVIEIDKDLIPALALRCKEKGNLIIHEADALQFDLFHIIKKYEPGPLRLIGNLPYNISTPLIFHLLTYANHITDMHFMLQNEVVERMAATPGHESYGRLSIMVQYHCAVTALFHVPPDAFYPPPQVESRIVRLEPYHQPPEKAVDYEHFANIVRQAFSHRRKTLRNSLKESIDDTDWPHIPIDSHLRPEELNVKDYITISNYLVNR